MIEIKITTNNPNNYIFYFIRLKIGKNKGVTANAGTFFITFKNLIFLKFFTLRRVTQCMRKYFLTN